MTDKWNFKGVLETLEAAFSRESATTVLGCLAELKNQFPARSLEFECKAMGFAAIYGRKETINALIDAGIDVNIENGFHQIPLTFAVFIRDVEICNFLISKGANVHHMDAQKISLLHSFLKRTCEDESGHKIVRLLISAGADPSRILEGKGRNSLEEAAFSGNVEMISTILPFITTKPEGLSGCRGALAVAASKGEGRVMLELLRAGVSFDPIDPFKDSPLTIAIKKSHLDCMLLLLAAGAGTGNDGSPANSQTEHSSIPKFSANKIQAATAIVSWAPEFLKRILDERPGPSGVLDKVALACAWAEDSRFGLSAKIARSMVGQKAARMAVEEARSPSALALHKPT